MKKLCATKEKERFFGSKQKSCYCLTAKDLFTGNLFSTILDQFFRLPFLIRQIQLMLIKKQIGIRISKQNVDKKIGCVYKFAYLNVSTNRNGIRLFLTKLLHTFPDTNLFLNFPDIRLSVFITLDRGTSIRRC